MPEVRSTMVEAVLFRRTAGNPEYLLLRRAAHETVYPGMWQIITGTLDQGETALAGAGREIGEETGIRPIRFWVVPHISSFYDHRHDRISLIPVFAAEVSAKTDPTLSDEHDAWIWLPFAEARDRLVWPSQREGLRVVNEFIAGGGGGAGLVEVPSPATDG
jgi:8-oxo-dGTP pyrophosphatase MutT (NUDIX family)